MMRCSRCTAVTATGREPTCNPTSAPRLSRTSYTRQHQPSTQVCANSTDRNLASQRAGRQRKPTGSHVAWEMHARADRPGGPPQPLPPATNAVSVLLSGRGQDGERCLVVPLFCLPAPTSLKMPILRAPAAPQNAHTEGGALRRLKMPSAPQNGWRPSAPQNAPY